MEEQKQQSAAPAPAPTGGASAPAPDNKTLMAFLAYIIFFIPLLTESKRDPFVKFHVKQGLGLLLLWMATWVVGFLPFIWIVVPFLQIAVVVLWVFGVVHVFQNKQEPLPLVGQFFTKFNF